MTKIMGDTVKLITKYATIVVLMTSANLASMQNPFLSPADTITMINDNGTLRMLVQKDSAKELEFALRKVSAKTLNFVDMRGYTILHDAIDHKAPLCLKLLLRHKDTNLKAQTNAGFTVLHLAVALKDPKILGILISTSKVVEKVLPIKDYNKKTALQYAKERLMYAHTKADQAILAECVSMLEAADTCGCFGWLKKKLKSRESLD